MVCSRMGFFLVGLFLVACVSWGSSDQCLKASDLSSSMKSGEFRVLTVSRDCLKNQDDYQLSPEDFRSVLSQTVEYVPQGNNLPVFVVLSEYFCSRKALASQAFCDLLAAVKTFSRGRHCEFFYVNFLYKLPADEIAKVDRLRVLGLLRCTTDELFRNAGDNGNPLPWSGIIFGSNSVSNCLRADLVEFGQGMFANETFVIHNGFVLARYKKSTYCAEDDTLIKGQTDESTGEEGGKRIKEHSRWLYIIGNGITEPVSEDNLREQAEQIGKQEGVSNEIELAGVLVSSVQTTICLDLSMQIHKWTYRIVKSFQTTLGNSEFALVDGPCREFFASYPNSDVELINLRSLVLGGKGPQLFANPDNFKLQIIQSNSVQVADYVLDFPQGQIVVQSDPCSTCVFRVNRPSHVERFKENSSVPRSWIARMSAAASVWPFSAKTEGVVKFVGEDLVERCFTCAFYELGNLS